MAELKTKQTEASVEAFLNSIEPAQKREDAKTIEKLMRTVSGEQPKMWGSAIVGYGTYHYTYASGREGDWMQIAFSPRKQNLTLYLMPGYQLPEMKELLGKLGKHSLGKGCLYIKRLADVDLKVLEQLMRQSLRIMNEKVHSCSRSSHSIQGEGVTMRKKSNQRLRYEPEVDVLSWEVSDQPIDSAREVGNLVIHLAKDQTPVLVEVLEARKFLKSTQHIVAKQSGSLA